MIDSVSNQLELELWKSLELQNTWTGTTSASEVQLRIGRGGVEGDWVSAAAAAMV